MRLLPQLVAAGGYHLVPMAPKGALAGVYRAATLRAADAPGFIEGGDVPTLQLETVLAAVNLPTDDARYADTTRFIDGFAGLLPRLSQRFPDSVWKDLDLNAHVPGWRRQAYAARVKPTTPVGQEQVPTDDVVSAAIESPPSSAPLSLAIAAAPPLAAKTLPEGGLIAELAVAVLKETAAGQSRGVATGWSADWEQLTDAVLGADGTRLGVTWGMAACGTGDDGDPSAGLCDGALLSDALFPLPSLLFVRSDNRFDLASEENAAGAVLCAPMDRDLPVLTGDQRQWLTEKKLGLAQPPHLADCLGMVAGGDADGVVANGIEGRFALAQLDLAQKVRAKSLPGPDRSIHIACPRGRPGDEAMLADINAAIARLKQNGRFEEIVAKHAAELDAPLPAK